MTEIKIRKIIWDEWNLNHIKKHKVRKEEVFEAVKDMVKVIPSYKERRLVFGVTRSKRLIAVALEEIEDRNYYVMTARDASRKERKKYYDK